jgi:3-hydroxybutyryl-CoA dehydrogenase
LKIEDVKRICVVGAGSMGHQIALCAALGGFQVVCTDISQAMLNKAEDFTRTYLPERVAKGKLRQDLRVSIDT